MLTLAKEPKKKVAPALARLIKCAEQDTRTFHPSAISIRSGLPPRAIFKHVAYNDDKGANKLAASPLAAARSVALGYILKRFDVPIDFERPLRFGPLAGSSYTNRVVQSYLQNRLIRNGKIYEASIEKSNAFNRLLLSLTDQGYGDEESSKMLLACGGDVAAALLLLSDN